MKLECPGCETLREGRFCPECGYDETPPFWLVRLWRRLRP